MNALRLNHILKCHDIVKTDFVRGNGCYLMDGQGRRYIDFESGIWCTALGHNHPRIGHAMKMQIDALIHLGTRYPSSLAEEAAVSVLEITHMDDGKCLFLSSGSEAVEFGAQAIRRVTNRPALLTFSNSYLSAYGSAGNKNPNEWFLLDWQSCGPDGMEACLSAIPFDRIGGFVFEPGGGGSGFVRFPPESLVETIARRVRQSGGLLMANEVTTGMGRTGRWFGFQHYDFHPDIVALGKGLGNGYPVSAVAMKRNVADTLESVGLLYAQSHQNDPLGCAVASEVIAVMREEKWVDIARETGAFFLKGLKCLESKYAVIKESRGRGMLLGLELRSHDAPTAQFLYEALLEKGFLTGYYAAGHILRFDPALTMKRADIESLLENLAGILDDWN